MGNYQLEEVPVDYLMLGQILTIAGVMNLVGGTLATVIGFAFCVGTYGCCFPFMFMGLPAIIVGIFELQWGMRAQKGKPIPDLRQKALAGLLSSILLVVTMTLLGIPGLILEILIQTKLNERDVTAFLEEIDD